MHMSITYQTNPPNKRQKLKKIMEKQLKIRNKLGEKSEKIRERIGKNWRNYEILEGNQEKKEKLKLGPTRLSGTRQKMNIKTLISFVYFLE